MRRLAKVENLSREEWLKIRRKGIGGSDIAAICELSNYKSPLWVYLDKKGLLPKDDEENIAAELGLELEDFLSRKFVQRIKKNEGIDIDLKKMPWILQHDTIDYFLVNLDRFFKHPEKGWCVVEEKTTTEFKRDAWKDDEVPDNYYAQVQWQLYITGWHWGYLIYLIGNRTVDIKLIERNEKVIKELVDKGKDFQINFIEKNIPPAPIGLDSDDEAIKILYPNEVPKSGLKLSGEAEARIILMANIIDKQKVILKTATKEKDRAGQIIKAEIGDNERMIAGDRIVTYKTVSKETYTVKASKHRKLHIGKK